MTTTIGVFDTHAAATAAVEGLKDQGVTPEQISYIQRTEIKETPIEVTSATETGAIVGAVAGLTFSVLALPAYPLLVAGPIIPLLGVGAGTVVGLAAGGLLGAIIDLGFSQDEAEKLVSRVEAGDVLVSVHADIAYDELMSQRGAVAVYQATRGV